MNTNTVNINIIIDPVIISLCIFDLFSFYFIVYPIQNPITKNNAAIIDITLMILFCNVL